MAATQEKPTPAHASDGVVGAKAGRAPRPVQEWVTAAVEKQASVPPAEAVSPLIAPVEDVQDPPAKPSSRGDDFLDLLSSFFLRRREPPLRTLARGVPGCAWMLSPSRGNETSDSNGAFDKLWKNLQIFCNVAETIMMEQLHKNFRWDMNREIAGTSLLDCVDVNSVQRSPEKCIDKFCSTGSHLTNGQLQKTLEHKLDSSDYGQSPVKFQTAGGRFITPAKGSTSLLATGMEAIVEDANLATPSSGSNILSSELNATQQPLLIAKEFAALKSTDDRLQVSFSDGDLRAFPDNQREV
ncbi:BRCA2, helical, partial [Musa troglodytarum]